MQAYINLTDQKLYDRIVKRIYVFVFGLSWLSSSVLHQQVAGYDHYIFSSLSLFYAGFQDATEQTNLNLHTSRKGNTNRIHLVKVRIYRRDYMCLWSTSMEWMICIVMLSTKLQHCNDQIRPYNVQNYGFLALCDFPVLHVSNMLFCSRGPKWNLS